MIVETIYAGRNNTFSLQLVRGDLPINLTSIGRYVLYFSTGRVFDDPTCFTVKADGIVEISLGERLTIDDVGSYTAYLVTFDSINVLGVRWPNFKLKVLR